MWLFDFFKRKKKPKGLPHQLGLMFLFKDLVYWVDDGFDFLKRENTIFLDRNNLYLFCAVIIKNCYEIFYFHHRNKDHIEKEFLEEYYQSIIDIIKIHNNIEYNEAYDITKKGIDYFKNIFEESAKNKDWSLFVDKFFFAYTHLDGLDEEKHCLASALPPKCKEIIDQMVCTFN